jgi:hypothetical protein
MYFSDPSSALPFRYLVLQLRDPAALQAFELGRMALATHLREKYVDQKAVYFSVSWLVRHALACEEHMSKGGRGSAREAQEGPITEKIRERSLRVLRK